MNCVDQSDATAYCAWRHPAGRLPTRAEFFWAAQGREQARRFPWGAERPSPAHLNACGRECYEEAVRRGWEPEVGPMYDDDDGWPITGPVGVHPDGISRDGLHDLAGNVEEWTADRNGGYWVVVGGSWGSSLLVELGPQLPSFGPPLARNSLIGFRCARTIQSVSVPSP
jgi:formylglycine-generating enzyme required for sulfatase activity